MATSYKTPGVYLEEISTLPASVAPVETAIPAFIGRTEKALDSLGSTLTNIPTRITSMLEYEQYFGGRYSENAVFAIAIADLQAGTAAKTRTITVTETKTSASGRYMHYSLQMYFANGGGACYIVSTGAYTAAVDLATVSLGLAAIAKVDEPTMLVFPDKPATNYKGVYDAALLQAKTLGDRVVIMDIWGETGKAFDDSNTFRNDHVSADNLKYGMAYYPFLISALNYGISESTLTVTHTLQIDANPVANSTFNGQSLSAISTADPNLYRELLAKINEKTIELPPSASIAGVYARVDNDRGVWKAPANVSILSITGPTIKVTSEEQETLNVDPTSGKSINVIRTFVGKGTLVWGARTLAGNDNEWRYVNVRRFYNFAEESIKKATEFVVFEPNDANTWLRTKTMIENFLTSLWRQGALQGAKPDDAFFVKVGLGVTMTAQDILEGRMNVEIGMAVVRPAEFIILKFSHLLQKS